MEMEREGRLLQAAVRGDKEALLQLLKEDTAILDRALSECSTGKDNNPLHLAALYGDHVDFVREILSRKPDLARGVNSQGQSPLHVASARGHAGVVRGILHIVADARLVRDRDGRIPLHVAAIKGRIQILQELLKTDKTTAFLLTDREEPILHLCANHKQFKALKMLVALVGDDDKNLVNLKDGDGNNILHILSANNEFTVIRFLAKRTIGLDTNAVNAAGFTPLDVSLKYGNGFFGWITDWALIISGAKTESAFTFKQMTKIVNISYDRGWFNEALLVVAILTITVSFQAGINPPGGLWQQNGNYTITGTQSNVSCNAWQSVMSCVDPNRYNDFSLYNRATILSSMLVMILLLVRCLIRCWFLDVFPIIFTFISISSMLLTYDASIPLLQSSKDDSLYGGTYTSLVLILLCVFMLIAAAPFMAALLLTANTAFILTRKAIALLTCTFKIISWAFLEPIRFLKRSVFGGTPNNSVATVDGRP